jgi:hypothetical protein
MPLPGVATVDDVGVGPLEGADCFIGPLDGAGVVGGPVVDEDGNADLLEVGAGGDAPPELRVLLRCAVATLDPSSKLGSSGTDPLPVVVEGRGADRGVDDGGVDEPRSPWLRQKRLMAWLVGATFARLGQRGVPPRVGCSG